MQARSFLESQMPPVVCVVGKSGSGKTTLMERLIPALKSKGLKVGTIKHDVHGFELDHPGKDSWRHKQAGSEITIISAPKGIGMVKDVDHDHVLEELMPFLCGVDIILTEGYKRENKPKVEIFRQEVHAEPLCRNDRNLVALITDADIDLGVPRFRTGDIEGLTDFLIRHFKFGGDR